MRIPIDRYIKKTFFHLYAPFGLARSPNHVTLDITRRCNLRCQMCFYYGGEKRSSQSIPEISKELLINNVINKLSGVDYDITGGEPFVRSDIFAILAAIKKRKAGCFIVTNGTLISRNIADRLVGDGLVNLISFSIHGERDVHDKVTRVPGSYGRALRGIEFIHRARDKFQVNKPETAIACTVNHANIRGISDILGLRSLTGVDHISLGCCSFLPLEIKGRHESTLLSYGMPCDGRYDDLVTGPPELEVTSQEVNDFIDSIKNRRQSGEAIGTSPKKYSYDDIFNHFLNRDWMYKTKCTYPWRNLRIAPDGSVVPCVGYLIGNVNDEDVNKLWNNSRFRKFRSVLYKNKLFPGCFRCCKLK